jgi:hypothetical protein
MQVHDLADLTAVLAESVPWAFAATEDPSPVASPTCV